MRRRRYQRFKPAHIVGPWRCTDQNTGPSTYGVYGEDGALSYYGDDANHGDKPISRPGLPITWALDGNCLTWCYEAAHAGTVGLRSLGFVHFRVRRE
jgi:hypothetical protein